MTASERRVYSWDGRLHVLSCPVAQGYLKDCNCGAIDAERAREDRWDAIHPDCSDDPLDRPGWR